MKLLEERILRDAVVLNEDVIKVGSFLNQQLDTPFLAALGQEIARLFRDAGITKILTIEASGIAIAMAAAMPMNVPVVFAKKSRSTNQSLSVYSAKITSFTHGNTYDATVAKEYLHADDVVLIVDDFLATGEAMYGLISIVKQAGAKLAGCSAAIEKGFQHGGDSLREKGIRVESLAIIDSMSENKVVFRK